MAQLITRFFSLTQAQQYGIAIVGVVITAMLRLALDPVLGEQIPLFLFVFPIMLAGWSGGFGPGLTATVLSLLFADYLFLAPRGSLLQYGDVLNRVRVFALGFSGMTFSLLFDKMRKVVRAHLECLERFRLIVESARDYAIVTLDPEGRVTCWNAGAMLMDGYEDSEVIGRDFSMFYAPEDVASGKPLSELKTAVVEGRFEEEGWQIRKDGTRFWASGVITPLRDNKGQLRGFAKVTRDVTEHRRKEERTRFISQLNDALMPLANPEEIMSVAVRMLGEFLAVDRCGYARVDTDEDHFVVLGDYTRGETRSITGRYVMSDFGEREREVLLGNHPYVVNDIEAESPPGEDLSLYRMGEIRAMVCVPLKKGGHFVARMAVHQKTPRRWTDDEVGLVTTVANRCWESVERAEAARQLKASDERYRAFIANSSEAIWRFELEKPIPAALPDQEQFEMLYQYAYLAECNDAMARMYGYDSADQILGKRIGELLPKSEPQNFAFLEALKRASYRLVDVETSEVDRFGNTKYFLNNMIGIEENGAIVRAWGTQRDISSRKLAEEALRASEERYRLLTELAPDGVVIASPAGAIHFVNPSMLRMLGAAAEDVADRNLFDFIAPEYWSHCRDCMTTLIQSGGPAKQVDVMFRTADGRNFPVEVNAVHFDWRGQPFVQIFIHDISARRQAESERERLRGEIEGERNRLRQILEQMPIGVAIAEAPSGRMLFHNVEAIQLLGHPALEMDDYKGLAQYGGLHEDGSPYLAEEYPMARALISAEVIRSEEMKYRRRDGTVTFLSVDSAPIYDREGRMMLVVVTFIDIAERKRAEEALRESEERFAKAFRTSPDSLIISRIADGIILETNDSFVSQSGYERHELIGKSTLTLGLFVNPLARERMVSILKERNLIRDFEFEMRRKSGEVRLMSLSAEPFDVRGEHCWLTIGRDITERRQFEEARRRNEEEVRRQLAYVEAIYATAPVGLCFVDTDLRYRSINSRLAGINGKPIEAHLGRTLREVVPETAEAIEPYYRRVIETGEPVLDVEMSSAAKSGTIQHFIVSYYPVKAGVGVIGVNVVVVDITQRKQIEEEREQLLQEEKSAREEAEVASRMKDEFLATISHELRTPLTSIMGWAHVLAAGSLRREQALHAIEVIVRSAQSQAKLIDDILDTSRIITGQLKLDAHPVEIERVFQTAVEVVRPGADAKRIDLRQVIDDRGAIVLGDANRLQQAIWNVLSNAVKFTNEGGRIEARLNRVGGHIEISISDTGIGIDPQFLPYMFERFRQADSSSTRRYGGLGLGLAIVRHIVEMHGGSILASSPGKGRGSTFTLSFPTAAKYLLPKPEIGRPELGMAEATERLVPASRCRLDGVRVLVVEDDPDTLDMLRMVLDNCGASVATAASTREALGVFDRWRPDALISDVAMPDQDGYALIGKVRSRRADQGGNIPAVALTAFTRDEDRVHALAAGFQMYVTKPVAPDELVAVVASLTGRGDSS